MTFTVNGVKIKKIIVKESSGASKEVKRFDVNGIPVWYAGNNVVYHLNSNTQRTEFVEYGNSALSPTSFNPSDYLPETGKGWKFHGWRQDRTASASVETSLAMGDAPIHLYAVYKRTVTLSYAGNGATSGSMSSQSGTRYWNNGSTTSARFTLKSSGFSKTNYKFKSWAVGSTGGTKYNAGAAVDLKENTTAYAVWQLTTLTSWFEVHGVAQGGTVNKTIGTFDLSGLNTLTAVIKKQNYNGNGSGGTVGIYINGTRVIYEDRFTSSREDETYTSTANISAYGANSKITTVATGNNEDVLTITSLKAN